jgi:hypothetical protein
MVRSLLIVATWLSNIYLVGSAGMVMAARTPPLFYSSDQQAAFDWMRDNLAWEDTTLASYRIGNLIPARTGHRVFLGHWSESVDWPTREAQVTEFFAADAGDDWRLALLQRHGVVYVFHGPDERALGGFDPEPVPWLEQVFLEGDVAIYRVWLEE